MIRLVTRLSHSRSAVEVREPRRQNGSEDRGAAKDWILLPSNARRRFKRLLDLQAEMVKASEGSRVQRPDAQSAGPPSGSSPRASPTTMFRENPWPRRGLPASVLKICDVPAALSSSGSSSLTSTRSSSSRKGIPSSRSRSEGLFGIPGKKCSGRPAGRCRPPASSLPTSSAGPRAPDALPRFPRAAASWPTARPSSASGCPHVDTFKALNKVLEDRQAATSSATSAATRWAPSALQRHPDAASAWAPASAWPAAPPTPASGPAVSVIGDSTFAHSGITPSSARPSQATPT